ncbi:hypothetical protein LCGC14_2900410, partial [marine sediment metagenome]
ARPGDRLRLKVEGPDFNSGQLTETTVVMDIADEGTAPERIGASGLMVMAEADVMRLDEPMFGTPVAEKLGIFDFYADDPVRIASVQAPRDRLPAELFYIPALLLLGLVIVLQRRRQTKPAF